MEPKWAVIAGLLVMGGLLVLVDKAFGRRLPAAELEQQQGTARTWGGRLGVLSLALLAIVTAVGALLAWRDGNPSGSVFLLLLAVVSAVGGFLSLRANGSETSL